MILICDILKALCDINTISDPRDKEEFTEFIYRNILPQAVNPILSSAALVSEANGEVNKNSTISTKASKPMMSPRGMLSPRGVPTDDTTGESRFVIRTPRSGGAQMDLNPPMFNKDTLVVDICELVCFCLARHGTRIRSLLTTTWLLSRISMLLNSTHSSHVTLAALRLLRTIVGVRDEQLDMFVVKANLLQPAIDLFVKNSVHNNMTNSAVLEMVDFMRRKNIVVLISYLAETFGTEIEKLRPFYPTFDKLIERYRQNKEHESTMFSFMS